MTELNELLQSLAKLPTKRALIVDDAYDSKPDAEALELVPKLVLERAGKKIRSSGVRVREELGALLIKAGFEADDYESGFGDDAFVMAVWDFKQAQKLRGREMDQLFENFLKEQENKRADLKAVETLLEQELGFEVERQGKQWANPAKRPALILLDLFLTYGEQKDAIDTSVQRIQRLLEAEPETNRPLIVLMSTKAEKLGNVGLELKQRAGLMGSKFRTAHKEELGAVLISQLKEMLDGLDESEQYAEWLQAWQEGLSQASKDLVARLRLLDLSDLAYLYRYRLQYENMPIGTYLRKLAEDQMIYFLESSKLLQTRTEKLNKLKFPKTPTAHFLPSEILPKLKHSSSFVSEVVLQTDGYQFVDAKSKLVLGDILVKKPSGWRVGMPVKLVEGAETLVVMSQSCDILQCKTDSLLLLRGHLTNRKWIDDVSDPQSQTDVFIFNGEKFQIDWQKAGMTAWELDLVDNRVAPRLGQYMRIARYREIEALRLQNLFASNLTRVGLFTSPHQHWNVGIRINVPVKQGGAKSLLERGAADMPAAIIKASYIDEKNSKKKGNFLVFDPRFKQMFVEAVQGFDWPSAGPRVAETFRAVVGSQAALAGFANAHSKNLRLGPLSIPILPIGNDAPLDRASLEILDPKAPVEKAAKARGSGERHRAQSN